MTSDQALARVIDRLELGAVGYLLVGALSSNLYGVPRATDDADVEVLFDGASVEERLLRRLPFAAWLGGRGSGR